MTPRGGQQFDSTTVSVEEDATAMRSSSNTEDHHATTNTTQPPPTAKQRNRRLSAFRLPGVSKNQRERRRSFPRQKNHGSGSTVDEESDNVSLIEQNQKKEDVVSHSRDREGDSDDGNIHELSPELESKASHHRTSTSRRSVGLLRRWRSDSTRQGPINSQPSTTTASGPLSLASEDDLQATRVFTVRAMKRPDEFSYEDSEFNRQGSRVALFDGDEKDEPSDQLTVANHPLQASNGALSGGLCATAILQHSYLETICGSPQSECESTDCWKEEDHIVESNTKAQLNNKRRYKKQISDDPTVQESIECVFASTLNENLALMLQEDDDEERQSHSPNDHLVEESTARNVLVAPSVLQQSLMRNRSDRGMGKDNNYLSPAKPKPRNQKRQESLKLMHVGTYDPNGNNPAALSTREAGVKAATVNTAARSSRECVCCKQRAPIVGADRWPQRPILLRPTPSSGTVVKGIRRAGSTEYLWESNSSDQSNVMWPNALRRQWGMDASETETNPMDVMCSRCMILPINNGNEGPGEALVTDFESELFEGSLLLRLRNSEGTTPQPYSDDFGYFHGMNRRYQAVIRGRFKAAIPWTECTTGFTLDRPCGKLPPKWILKGGLKVLSFFAPQLQARLDGPSPSSLAPLGSTPQVLSVHESETEIDAIDHMKYEPTEDKHALLGEAFESNVSLQRARHRKKRFDKLFTEKSRTPLTDPNKIYTFEFLQHLFNFNEFSIDLGAMLGSIPLKELLDGQPLQVMAQHQSQHQCNKLWSFDVWHTTLLQDAKKHDQFASS